MAKSGTISDFVAFLLSSYFLLWHAQKRNYQKRNEKGKKFSDIFDKQFMKLHFNCHLSTTKNVGEKATACKVWHMIWANAYHPGELSIPVLVCHGAPNYLV